MFKTKKLVLSGIFIAIGILLPMIFHSFGLGGPIFLPMHIPVLIAAMILGPIHAGIIGIITPLLSSILTGMPPLFPMLPIMTFELGVYGISTGYFNKLWPDKEYLSLILGMIDGRITAAIVVLVLSIGFGTKLNAISFIKAAILTGIPGIAIQIIVIPPLVKLIKRSLDL